MKLRDEIIELFPTEDPDFLYISSYESKENESVGARGCLYNFYKTVRKDLRDAGILSISTTSANLESENIQESK